MPMALSFSRASRMILRPEPPSSPCSGWMRSGDAWKCSSKSFLRTSMDAISSHSVLANRRNYLLFNIADSPECDLVDGELLSFQVGMTCDDSSYSCSMLRLSEAHGQDSRCHRTFCVACII